MLCWAVGAVLLVTGCKPKVEGGGNNGVGGIGGSQGTGGDGGSSTTSTSTTGVSCPDTELVLPQEACTPSAPSCHTATNACFAVKEHAGAPIFGMRVTQLDVTKPSGLTKESAPIVSAVLDGGLYPYQPECGVDGDNTFNWLLAFDRTTNKLTTGTSPYLKPPVGAYSFDVGGVFPGVDTTLSLDPATMDLSFEGTCAFQSSPADVILRMFLTGPADSFLLPIDDLRVSGSLSADHNCIGTYDLHPSGSGAECWQPGYANGGVVRGMISLAKADQVPIPSLKNTLCVLLVGEGDDNNVLHRCVKDGNGGFTAKGDACLATGGPATPDCADALFFEASFAASGVEISP